MSTQDKPFNEKTRVKKFRRTVPLTVISNSVMALCCVVVFYLDSPTESISSICKMTVCITTERINLITITSEHIMIERIKFHNL
jgi:hypothetical protein